MSSFRSLRHRIQVVLDKRCVRSDVERFLRSTRSTLSQLPVTRNDRIPKFPADTPIRQILFRFARSLGFPSERNARAPPIENRGFIYDRGHVRNPAGLTMPRLNGRAATGIAGISKSIRGRIRVRVRISRVTDLLVAVSPFPSAWPTRGNLMQVRFHG